MGQAKAKEQMTLEEISDAAMGLSVEDRESLIHILDGSLRSAPDAQALERGLAETKRRICLLEEGKSRTMSVDEFKAELQRRKDAHLADG